MTMTAQADNEGSSHPTHAQPARLILRARPLDTSPSRKPRVQWGENVIDNEGLGRKKSKGSHFVAVGRAIVQCSLLNYI